MPEEYRRTHRVDGMDRHGCIEHPEVWATSAYLGDHVGADTEPGTYNELSQSPAMSVQKPAHERVIDVIEASRGVAEMNGLKWGVAKHFECG